MRRNRKNSIKKERIIMIASSAFVLAALTMTGVYMKDKTAKSKDDGYTIDFSALENNVDDKYEEIAQNQQTTEAPAQTPENNVAQNPVTEDDLDYLPMTPDAIASGEANVDTLEAGSGDVEIPGLTDGGEELAGLMGSDAPDAEGVQEAEELPPQDAAVSANTAVVGQALHFAESDGLLRPAVGDIMMHYSMDSSVYFATLDQYKYNPAVLFYAEQGDEVKACAAGKVLEVFQNEEIGQAVTLELGDGYQATYGQLVNIKVEAGSVVESGQLIGYVDSPTKYYSVEGTNLYFRLDKDGSPVNPEGIFQ